MDNYKYGAYVSGKISYLDFMKSYQSVSENKYTDWYNGIYILSYKKVYDYGMCIFKKTYKHKFDLHIVHKLICDFLDEEPTDEMWVLPASLCGEEKIEIPKKYGIGIYNYLLEYVDLLQKDVQLEFRAFYTLCEHKKIIDDLIRRIYSIIGETHLQQKINKLSKQCLDMSEIVNGLSIKYYVNPNKDILKKIKTLLYNLKRADYALFNDLKNEINNYFEMLG